MSKTSAIILGISAVAGSVLGYYFTTPQGKETFNRIVDGANKIIDLLEEGKSQGHQAGDASQSLGKSFSNQFINN